LAGIGREWGRGKYQEEVPEMYNSIEPLGSLWSSWETLL
jgi:hypothetical protein